MSTEEKSRAELLEELRKAKENAAILQEKIKASHAATVKDICENFLNLLKTNELSINDALSYFNALGEKTEKKVTAKGQLSDEQKKQLGNYTYYNSKIDKEWKLGKKGPVPNWIFEGLTNGDVLKYKRDEPTVNE